MADSYNTDWSGVPHSNERAGPVAFRHVEKKPVIQVQRASIRNAIIENAYFELVEYGTARKMENGKHKVEVKCLWYGCKPATTWMHITVDGPYTVLGEYTGQVVHNISG